MREVTQSDVQAIEWFQQAAAQDFASAAQELQLLLNRAQEA